MHFQIDTKFMTDCFAKLVSVPSPVGYFEKLNPVLEDYAAQFGCPITFDNRHTAYITLEGQDNSKTVLIGAHADTLGMMVRSVDSNGMLRFRVLGGMNLHSVEGETVTVHASSGKTYTGLVACQTHSTHVFRGANNTERTEDTMVVLLDENVKTREEVRALGICNGDYISVDPRFQITETGYIKSRFIDDKGPMACCLTLLKYMKDNGLKPKYKTLLAFPYFEEVGTGGRYVPEEVSEYSAVDIALIGPELDGNEHSVTICAKDANGPYDYAFRKRLTAYAQKAGCRYAEDIFLVYSSDAHAVERGGNNVSSALIGMGTFCTHGMERTHIEGMENTVKLMLAYSLDI